MRDFLPANAPRVVVDVDAGDGSAGSLSREFIEQEWRALLIEGAPDKYDALLSDHCRTAGVEIVHAYCSVYNSERNGRARSLTWLLHQHAIPRNFSLLILNNSASALQVLKGLDPVAFQPALIVTRDIQATDAERTAKYSLLFDYGYAYASASGDYSIWASKSNAAPEPVLSATVDLPTFPESPGGQAAFDPAISALQSCGALRTASYPITGWAFVESSDTVPPLVFLEVQDARTQAAEYFQAQRCPRPDVSAHFGRPELLLSGFRAFVPLGKHQAGALSVRVIQANETQMYRSSAELRVERPLQEYESTVRVGLANKFLSGSGIEIGALQRPLQLPGECRIRYVDRMPFPDLLRHYPELNKFPIQPPDLIDDGEHLTTIADSSQDFVVANHFFEHCRNPIQTLKNLLRVIKSGGILFIAVPDKRYTFDFERPSTAYETVRRAFEKGERPDVRELFEEWVAYIERRSDAGAAARASELLASNYSIHYNVWTVDELLSHLIQARMDFALPFRIVSVVCCDNEAILLLEKSGKNSIAYDSAEVTGVNNPAPEDPPVPHPDPPAVQNSSDPMSSRQTAISGISPLDSSRTSVHYPLWKYVIPLPPDSLMWSVGGSSPEIFLVLGDAWAQLVSRYAPEKATALDIGCGCGRTARVLVNNKWITRYIGFDVIRENVEWCNRFVAPAFEPRRAEFYSFDLYSAEYNPQGAIRASELTFPCEEAGADAVFAASVFTHLLEPDCVHYLQEVARVLSPRGTALLSIHNAVPSGTRFYGTETRIDIESSYFVELADQAGLGVHEIIDDLGGQQVFVFKRK